MADPVQVWGTPKKKKKLKLGVFSYPGKWGTQTYPRVRSCWNFTLMRPLFCGSITWPINTFSAGFLVSLPQSLQEQTSQHKKCLPFISNSVEIFSKQSVNSLSYDQNLAKFLRRPESKNLSHLHPIYDQSDRQMNNRFHRYLHSAGTCVFFVLLVFFSRTLPSSPS